MGDSERAGRPEGSVQRVTASRDRVGCHWKDCPHGEGCVHAQLGYIPMSLPAWGSGAGQDGDDGWVVRGFDSGPGEGDTE